MKPNRPYDPAYRPNLDVKHLSTITPDTRGGSIEKMRCLGKGPDSKVAVTTENSLQVYSATSGTLLWDKTSTSPDLEAHSTFTKALVTSPDGSLICTTVRQGDSRKLLVFDQATGHLKNSLLLAQNDSDMANIASDNSKALFMQWGGSTNAVNLLKIVHLGQTPVPPEQIVFKSLGRWRGVGAAYAPDSRHIIVIEGPGSVEHDFSNLSVSVRIYDDQQGCLVTTLELPGPESVGFLTLLPPFRAEFLHLDPDQWLLCVPDYHECEKSRIVDVKTGKTVVSVTADRTFSQAWTAGLLPSLLVEMSCDTASGTLTRTEISETIIPRGKTVTITRFTIEGAKNRERAVRDRTGERWARVKVVKMGIKDVCQLSKDGLQLLIHREGTNKLDLLSLSL
jgi:hypothetical protein